MLKEYEITFSNKEQKAFETTLNTLVEWFYGTEYNEVFGTNVCVNTASALKTYDAYGGWETYHFDNGIRDCIVFLEAVVGAVGLERQFKSKINIEKES